MKTKQEVLDQYKSQTIDGRDLNRLADFYEVSEWHHLGGNNVEPIPGSKFPGHVVKEWTRENILEQLEKDVAFGFEKALDQRGISSSLMYSVVSMWNWILEEGLEGFQEYAQYGLPLFKATAVKYGFPNPIGDDAGNEEKYSNG